MKSWIYNFLILLGIFCICLVIWFTGPLVGFGDARPFSGFWTRFLIVFIIVLICGLVFGIRYWRKRKAQKELEASLTEIEEESEGDAPLLAERMAEALDVLKKTSGSKNPLYELPWYIIIGPPGVGKTTALINSGLKFPIQDGANSATAVSGIGGTRYCDWWFADEAVIVDTAGRYTTHDSDSEEDKKSWLSFLGLLKKNRTKQPLNGVIVAISVEDLLTLSEDELAAHSTEIRKRLVEIHAELKIDFPVYALFTKSDLISGFSEYFGNFSESRRRQVWGATFQTNDRRANMVKEVPAEFDALNIRLTEELTDRLQEELDGVARISIFGFPTQFSLLKDKVSAFLNQIFEPNRYQVSANLRGFYFTSGTQEGTAIDQALGEMGRNFGRSDSESFLSGTGKSFFLYDLMKSVIFGESGWVTYDRAAVQRAGLIRYGAIAVIAMVSICFISVWSWSFYNNNSLISATERAVASYRSNAANELASSKISDHNLAEVLPYLDELRNLPVGYEVRERRPKLGERFGLSQRESLASAAQTSYRAALERMFRSRLIFRLERQIETNLHNNDPLANYETLKVYMMLGGVANKVDKELVVAWVKDDWSNDTNLGGGGKNERLSVERHLRAMLDLDVGERPTYLLNKTLIASSQKSIATLAIADRAYAYIKSLAYSSDGSDLEDFDPASRAGQGSDLVFETIDGTDFAEIRIPKLFTYRGFHEFFLNQLSSVAVQLKEEQWVLGDFAENDEIQRQFSGLGPQVLDRYGKEFEQKWLAVLNNLKFKPLSGDKPNYGSLTIAAAPISPIKALFTAVSEETKLTENRLDEEDSGVLAGTDGEGKSVRSEVASIAARRIRDRANGLTRIGLDMAIRRRKSQGRAGSNSASARRIPGANIEARFLRYHELVEGEHGNRPIDRLVANYHEILQSLVLSESAGPQANTAKVSLQGQLSNLRRSLSRLPKGLARMVEETVDDFEGDAANSSLALLNQELATSVGRACQRVISDRFPFSRRSSRDVPMADFARLFAPNGVIDKFFLDNLASYVNLTGKTWRWKPDAFIGKKLSKATLRNFQRAADIRDAFFPSGGGMPGIGLTVRQTSLHGEVESALLTINGSVLQTKQVGNSPMNLDWPGSTTSGSVNIQLSPEFVGLDSTFTVIGPWALLRAIDRGNPKRKGDTLRVHYTIGGRFVAYSIQVSSVYNPFYMRALQDFKCPTGL